MKKLLSLLFVCFALCSNLCAQTTSSAQPMFKYLGKLASDPTTCSPTTPVQYWNTATRKFRYCSETNKFRNIGESEGGAAVISMRDFASLAAAAADLGATVGATLQIDSAVTANAAVFERNVNVRFADAGIVSVGNQSLTIKGAIDAPPNRKIFDLTGTGKVDLYASSETTLYPEWWGAKTNDNADDAAAIQAAINSVERLQNNFYSSGGGVSKIIQFSSGVYNLSNGLIISSPQILRGTGREPYGKGTILQFAAGKFGIKLIYQDSSEPLKISTGAVLEDFSVVGARADTVYRVGGGGIIVNSKVNLNRLRIQNFEGDCLFVEGTGAPTKVTNLAKFSDLDLIGCNGNGVYSLGQDANAMFFNGINASDNRGWGIKDSSGLGNTYIAPHVRGNVGGTITTTSENSAVADNVFIGAYSEADGSAAASFTAGTIVVGGTLDAGIAAGSRAFQMRGGLSGDNGTIFRPFQVKQTYGGNGTNQAQLFLGTNNAGDPGMLFGWTFPTDYAFTGTDAKFRFGTSYFPKFYSLTGAVGHLLEISTYRAAGEIYTGSPAVPETINFPDGFGVGGGWFNYRLSGDFAVIDNQMSGGARVNGTINLRATQGVGFETPIVRSNADVYVTSATKGIILKSPDGTCYRFTVANGGALNAGAAIPCP